MIDELVRHHRSAICRQHGNSKFIPSYRRYSLEIVTNIATMNEQFMLVIEKIISSIGKHIQTIDTHRQVNIDRD
jgi:hypothetical protein